MPAPAGPGGGDKYAAKFDELPSVDLQIDAIYPGGDRGNVGDDPIAKLVPGVGNQGGIRFGGTLNQGPKVVVLYTTGAEPDWPDALDPQTGLFTYYGDNRSPGNDLHVTTRRGNLLLRNIFADSHDPVARLTVPPILLFEKAGPTGRAVRLRGLLAPGGPALTVDDELQAVWRTTEGQRFQNYRARFTVLDQAKISRAWIDQLANGDDPLGGDCPDVWRVWAESRGYTPLTAPATTVIRTREQQLPSDRTGTDVLSTIREHFRDRETDFEECAVALWRFLAPATGGCEITRPSRDGGRDAIGQYHLGPPADRIAIDFLLEAKCYSPDTSVGVREGSRLISRIRHRNFGVLVTTSYFNSQMQHEIRDDQHPIVLVCGKDIVELLRTHGYSTPTRVKAWLDSQFPG